MADTSGGMMGPTQYFPMGVKSGEVLLVEADGPKTVRLNQTATYNVKVTNLTDNAVHNIMLMSTNPDGFQVTSAAPATTQPMDKGMGYAVGDLAAHESKTVMITGMATKVGHGRHLLHRHLQPAHPVHHAAGDQPGHRADRPGPGRHGHLPSRSRTRTRSPTPAPARPTT